MDNVKDKQIRQRIKELHNESPWMEEYEIEAIVCTEFGLDDLRGYADAFEFKDEKEQAGYTAIKPDAIGKFGAYAPSNEGSSQRKDFGTRALYDLSGSVGEDQESAVLQKAADTISKNIRREANRIGGTLIGFIVVSVLVFVAVVIFTALVMGWNITQTYDFVTAPKAMAMLSGGILLLAMAIPFLGYIFFNRLPIAEMIPLNRLRRGELKPMTLMGLALLMVNGCLINYINYPDVIRGANYGFDVVSLGSSVGEIIFSVVGLAIVPALVQSFVFDGVILQVLRRRGGDGFALIFTALLSMLMTTNFLEMPGAFFTALWIGYMVVFSGSIIPAITIYLSERLLRIAITQLGFLIRNAQTVQYIDCIVTLLLIFAGIFSFTKVLRRFPEFFVLKKSDPCLSLGKKMRIACTRPNVIALILFSVIFSLLQLFSLEDIIAFAGRF